MSISINRYSDDLKSAWDGLVSESPMGLFFFQRDYIDLNKSVDEYSLMVYWDESLVAVFPAILEGSTVYSYKRLTYGGLIYTNNMKSSLLFEIYSAVARFFKEKGIKELQIGQIPHFLRKNNSEADTYWLISSGAQIVTCDLSAIIDVREPVSFSSRKKKYIKKAEKLGCKVVESDTRVVDYHNLLSSTLQKKYDVTPTHSTSELKSLIENFQANISLHSVYLEDEMIAGAVTFNFDVVVHTQYLACSDNGQKIGALDYLIYKLCENAHGSGWDFISLGRSTEPGGGLNQGLLNYKEGFGSQIVPYYTLSLDLERL